MIVVVELLIVLVAARVLGWLSERVGQPPAFGEILAGVLLVLAVGAWAEPPAALGGLVDSAAIDLAGEVGIFFLLLAVGIEMKPDEILAHSRESLWVALGGVAVPFVGGFALAWTFLPDSGFKLAQAMVVGTALAITAIPVAAETFREFGLLHRPVGEVVIAAAIFDDVLGLVLLAIATGLIATGHFPGAAELGLIVLKVVAFFAVTVVLGRYVLPGPWRWLARRTGARTELTALLALALGFSLLALALDLHFVLGAFMAGLFFAPDVAGIQGYVRVKHLVATVTFGALAPVFFASIGLKLDLGAMVAIPGFLLALIVVAMIGKIVGAGMPALWAGLVRRDALAVGVGMTGRGAVELIVLSIAYKAGVFANSDTAGPLVANLFSGLVVTAVVTTLAMPVLLRWVLGARPPPDQP